VVAALDRRNVDYIAIDAGSTDAGPYFLGSGRTTTQRAGIKLSLEAILPVAVGRKIPLIIGSCGMSGTNSGVDLFREIVTEVARERGLHFTLGLIESEPPRDLIKTRLKEGRIRALPYAPELTEKAVDEASHIVAMQGTEPVTELLARGADVILSGRISDSAMFAAVPVMKGVPLAQAWHMAKVIDHGATNIEPTPGVDTSVYGIASQTDFLVKATHPVGRISRVRVAHSTVYENNSPFHMYEPPGMLDISGAEFEQTDEHTVTVRGSRFEELPYTVKLEGARLAGYRTITIAGVRDPHLIAQLDEFIESCKRRIAVQAALQHLSPGYRLVFRVYGRDGTMGAREPRPLAEGHELGLVVDAVARTQEEADAIANMVHLNLEHYHYPGRKHTTGNVSFPYSPSDISAGPVYEFSVWHVMELDEPMEACAIETAEI
jgi:hypothetical protein